MAHTLPPPQASSGAVALYAGGQRMAELLPLVECSGTWAVNAVTAAARRHNNEPRRLFLARLVGVFRFQDKVNVTDFTKTKWCFIETSADELANMPDIFIEPSASLLSIYKYGLAVYKAFGYAEETAFHTECFNMQQIIQLIQEHHQQ